MQPKVISNTYWCRIYIAGDYAALEEICRQYCEDGYCVNITPNNYIYKHGEQSGAMIELINYPRFPEEPGNIFRRAHALAHLIALECHQRSWTIMDPEKTVYYER